MVENTIQFMSEEGGRDEWIFREYPVATSSSRGGTMLRFSGLKLALLKLGVSAMITDDRIERVWGVDAAIRSLCAETPHNDIVRCPEDQVSYRRSLFNVIKALQGDNLPIHVFPALPASLELKSGRVWMPMLDRAVTSSAVVEGRVDASQLSSPRESIWGDRTRRMLVSL